MVDKIDEKFKKETGELDQETKDLKLTALPKKLSSKTNFNEAKKLINNITVDTNKAEPRYGNKKVFNDLEKLINDISNYKLKKESGIKRMTYSKTDLEELKKKESTVFKNKMIYVLYHLFDSFGLSEKPLLLFGKEKPDQLKLPKHVTASKERLNEILHTINKAKNNGSKIHVDGREITLDNLESLLKGIASGKINASQFKK